MDERVEAVVAGHMCVDIIPELPHHTEGFRFLPGNLLGVGPAAISTGGAVANTGIALHRLSVPVHLVARLGDDPMADMARALVDRLDPRLRNGLRSVPGESTSYSVILSPPGRDRMFLHCSGANDTFSADDVPPRFPEEARVFHFGYPPMMRRMYEGMGEELVRVFARAKDAGLTTALDLCYPDLGGPSGRADWETILSGVLPLVDVFLPSLEEALLLLEPERWRRSALAGHELSPAIEHLMGLGDRIVDMGAGIVVVKAGARGLYVRTAGAKRLANAGAAGPRDTVQWAHREMWSASFTVDVAGTTGAGDAAVAGFLLGLLHGMTPEMSATAAAAAGAASAEAADATSGVSDWATLAARIGAGWPRRDPDLGPDWIESTHPGIWVSRRDGSPGRSARRSRQRPGWGCSLPGGPGHAPPAGVEIRPR